MGSSSPQPEPQQYAKRQLYVDEIRARCSHKNRFSLTELGIITLETQNEFRALFAIEAKFNQFEVINDNGRERLACQSLANGDSTLSDNDCRKLINYLNRIDISNLSESLRIKTHIREKLIQTNTSQLTKAVFNFILVIKKSKDTYLQELKNYIIQYLKQQGESRLTNVYYVLQNQRSIQLTLNLAEKKSLLHALTNEPRGHFDKYNDEELDQLIFRLSGIKLTNRLFLTRGESRQNSYELNDSSNPDHREVQRWIFDNHQAYWNTYQEALSSIILKGLTGEMKFSEDDYSSTICYSLSVNEMKFLVEKLGAEWHPSEGNEEQFYKDITSRLTGKRAIESISMTYDLDENETRSVTISGLENRIIMPVSSLPTKYGKDLERAINNQRIIQRQIELYQIANENLDQLTISTYGKVTIPYRGKAIILDYEEDLSRSPQKIKEQALSLRSAIQQKNYNSYLEYIDELMLERISRGDYNHLQEHGIQEATFEFKTALDFQNLFIALNIYPPKTIENNPLELSKFLSRVIGQKGANPITKYYKIQCSQDHSRSQPSTVNEVERQLSIRVEQSKEEARFRESVELYKKKGYTLISPEREISNNLRRIITQANKEFLTEALGNYFKKIAYQALLKHLKNHSALTETRNRFSFEINFSDPINKKTLYEDLYQAMNTKVSVDSIEFQTLKNEVLNLTGCQLTEQVSVPLDLSLDLQLVDSDPVFRDAFYEVTRIIQERQDLLQSSLNKERALNIFSLLAFQQEQQDTSSHRFNQDGELIHQFTINDANIESLHCYLQFDPCDLNGLNLFSGFDFKKDQTITIKLSLNCNGENRYQVTFLEPINESHQYKPPHWVEAEHIVPLSQQIKGFQESQIREMSTRTTSSTQSSSPEQQSFFTPGRTAFTGGFAIAVAAVVAALVLAGPLGWGALTIGVVSASLFVGVVLIAKAAVQYNKQNTSKTTALTEEERIDGQPTIYPTSSRSLSKNSASANFTLLEQLQGRTSQSQHRDDPPESDPHSKNEQKSPGQMG
jgi:hypothetical protein